jgi:methylisocitrate lyase
MIEQAGFPLVYVSGAGIANGFLGVPDIGLLSCEVMVACAGAIVQAVQVPVIADADTGFGETLNVVQTVARYEQTGLAGLHLEDQELPKRCGHLPGKRLVPTATMEQKIVAAVHAKRNPDFTIIARTDARAVEGFDAAVARARRYVAAGADMLFPEALQSAEELAAFARAFPDTPLLANMTEFGQTPYLTASQLGTLGYRVVIFPMTLFRAMLPAVSQALRVLAAEGSQQTLLAELMPRAQLRGILTTPAWERWGESPQQPSPR